MNYLNLISLIFFALAGICNAIMDTLAHHHSISKFAKYATGFWADANIVSWRNKYIDGNPDKGRIKIFGKINKPEFLTDGWHLCKMLMVVLICLSIITFTTFINPLYLLLAFIKYGLAWNFSFNLFYNYALKKKL